MAMVKVSKNSTSTPVVEMVGAAMYPRLDRKDYGLWALNMEVAMEAQEIWEAVDPDGGDYAKGDAKYRKDRQALTALYSVVPKDVLQHLIGKKIGEGCLGDDRDLAPRSCPREGSASSKFDKKL
jgi:hypothetical protein